MRELWCQFVFFEKSHFSMRRVFHRSKLHPQRLNSKLRGESVKYFLKFKTLKRRNESLIVALCELRSTL